MSPATATRIGAGAAADDVDVGAVDSARTVATRAVSFVGSAPEAGAAPPMAVMIASATTSGKAAAVE